MAHGTVGVAPGTNRHGISLTPGIIRVPVSTVAGEVIYREIDLRANGDDPLMRWMRGAFDWDITNLKWDEQFQQPREVTWRGGTLWAPGTDGTVEILAQAGPLPARVNIKAAVRTLVRGTMRIHGFTWIAAGSAVVPNALWCEVCNALVTSDDTAVAGPYRSAGGGKVGHSTVTPTPAGWRSACMVSDSAITAALVVSNCVHCGTKPIAARMTRDRKDIVSHHDALGTVVETMDTVETAEAITHARVIPPTILTTFTEGPALVDDAFKVGIDNSIRKTLEVFAKHQKLR
jgi:hypothetical protein